MTTTVLMLETRAAGASTVHQSGTQYALSDDLAGFYIGKGYARLISPQPANLVPVMASNSVAGGISILWSGSQAEYDAIAVKDDSTLYVIV